MAVDNQGFEPGRRNALYLLAGGSLLLGAGQVRAAAPACVLTPEQTEGPYFVDGNLNRSDIRTDPATGKVSAGVPLQLQLRVSAIRDGNCQPLPGAVVDIWHCDADGVYSGVEGSPGLFLRGLQVADAAGVVNFTTIYPGWYPGRAVHIHFKIRVAAAGGRADVLTSQLYFDDAITDQVYRLQPYAKRPNRQPRNGGDSLFQYDQGRQLLLKPAGDAKGYVARFDIGLVLG